MLQTTKKKILAEEGDGVRASTFMDQWGGVGVKALSPY